MDTHKSVLRLVREQVKNHSLGKLVFLASIGPRAWGFAPNNISYDYQGIYLSKEDNTYHVFISGTSIEQARNISLISFERIIRDIVNSDLSALIFIKSPAIYGSKDFLKLRRRVNSNLSQQVYQACPIKQVHGGREDYLYDFFLLGNCIVILERKKMILNLSELNKKILKIPAIDKVIEEEKTGLPFENRQTCKEIQKKLEAHLEKAKKKSRLPEKVNIKKLSKLKIMRHVNYKFWDEEGTALRRLKEREKYKI